MCILIIEQNGFNRVEFEFDEVADAAEMMKKFSKNATKKTKFTIVEEVEEKGE